MSSMSQYLANKVLEHVTKRTVYTSPTMWLCLLEKVPTRETTPATFSEATYTGYARVEIGAWEPAEGGSSILPSKILNKELVKFGICTAGTSKVKAIAICDANTFKGGNMLYWDEVPEFEISTTNTPAESQAKNIELTQL